MARGWPEPPPSAPPRPGPEGSERRVVLREIDAQHTLCPDCGALCRLGEAAVRRGKRRQFMNLGFIFQYSWLAGCRWLPRRPSEIAKARPPYAAGRGSSRAGAGRGRAHF